MVSGLVTSPCDHERIFSGLARLRRMESKSAIKLARSYGLLRYKVVSSLPSFRRGRVLGQHLCRCWLERLRTQLPKTTNLPTPAGRGRNPCPTFNLLLSLPAFVVSSTPRPSRATAIRGRAR